MPDGTPAQRNAKREYTQLLRLHEQLLRQFLRARDELLAPGTDRLVKQIKARTGSEPDLIDLKTSVEEAIRSLKLSQAELLHCRVRYFSDGVVLGSKAFVDGVFERYRDRFTPKRQDGGRKLRWGEWGNLCALRALRVDVISPPGSG